VEIWEPQTPGALWVCPGLNRNYFNFTMKNESIKLKKIKEGESTAPSNTKGQSFYLKRPK
jgi:hypothetical protein